MTRQTVNSSNLESVGYDPVTKTLEVEFVRSGVYQFSDVSEQEYNTLMQADSKGSYFAKRFKGRPFVKVS